MTSYINPDNGSLVIKSVKDLDVSDISMDDAAFAVLGGQWVGGNLYVSGTLVANGDIVTLGNTGGSLTFNTNISSDVLPSATKTYNLGSYNYSWNNLNITNIQVNTDDVVSSGPVSTESTLSQIVTTTQPNIIIENGFEGQMKTITVSQQPSVPIVLTPNNSRGFNTISFTNEGDSATMYFINGSWNIISVFRASVS